MYVYLLNKKHCIIIMRLKIQRLNVYLKNLKNSVDNGFCFILFVYIFLISNAENMKTFICFISMFFFEFNVNKKKRIVCLQSMLSEFLSKFCLSSSLLILLILNVIICVS